MQSIKLKYSQHHYEMRNLIMLVAGTGIFELLQIRFYPGINLIMWLGLATMLDFTTAFYRAIARGEARNSSKVRATFRKVFMYFGSVLVVIIVENSFGITKGGPLQIKVVEFFNNLFVLLMIYAEALSILENIILLNKKDIFTEYVLTPIYRILTWQFKGNILTKIGKPGPNDKIDFLNEQE